MRGTNGTYGRVFPQSFYTRGYIRKTPVTNGSQASQTSQGYRFVTEVKVNTYKEALESMVWQFAYRGVKDNKPILWTAGLSALEEAFDALGWDNPKYFEDTDGVICDVKGCQDWVSNQGFNWHDTGYWCLCSKHGFYKESQPAMKQRALDREASRGEDGCLSVSS